jgi:hypothetical protein
MGFGGACWRALSGGGGDILNTVMRHFIRHPVDIPIEVEAGSHAGDHHEAHNLSTGGLSFDSGHEMAPGAIVELRIGFVEPAFETRARVAWCRRRGVRYELGVQFLNPDDAFRARMVEQVCYIEDYRRKVLEAEGRVLSAEEAAREWIRHYAGRFPDTGSNHLR